MWQNSKIPNVTKPKNSKCDRLQNMTTQKLRMRQNWITQNVTTLKNSKCDQTQKLQIWKNSTKKGKQLKNSKSKKLKNWKCDYSKKNPNVTQLKIWKNSKTYNGTSSNFKMWQNTTQNVQKLKNSKWDKTKQENQCVTKLTNKKCDKNLQILNLKKIKMLQNSRTQNVTTIKRKKECDKSLA